MKTSSITKLAMTSILTMLFASSVFAFGNTAVLRATGTPAVRCSKIDDATLANNVRDELAKTFTPGIMASIQITAKRRIVTLTGEVTYRGTRTKLTTLARRVACVILVFNKIKLVRNTTECTGGQQECCCPESGCECARICPICSDGSRAVRIKRPKPKM